MADYENWNGSRWEYTKSLSKWHFDTKRPPEPGIDSYTHVCRFDYDFTKEIEQCVGRASTSTWSSRNPNESHIYSAEPEEQDLIRHGADPKAPIFDRAKAEDIGVFQEINRWLGLYNSQIKFHNQKTGQMLHTHMDNFASRPERNNSYLVTDFDKNPNVIRRFAIMLADWQLGQIFQIGNANFTQWRAGDCITWEWRDMPHSTANMGWWDRPMLQITGYVSVFTDTILHTASKHKIVTLKGN